MICICQIGVESGLGRKSNSHMTSVHAFNFLVTNEDPNIDDKIYSGVVDENLLVYGTSNLRIVDAR